MRRKRSDLLWGVAAAGAAVTANLAQLCRAAISINQVNSTDWTISNGDLSVVFNPSGSNITSLELAGQTTNLLDPEDPQLYPEFAGTPFGSGTMTASYQATANYIDFWTTTQSNGTTNPITYSFHYVMFNDDPDVMVYEVLNHASTDPATSVGQGQFLARVNPTYFSNTYQYNVGPNNPGPQTSTQNNRTTFDTDTAEAGRTVQNVTYDLTGSGLSGNWGTNFFTKYNYSSYTQFLQATTEYGSQYATSALYTSPDTMTGGPTKQNLQITNDNILTLEFLSDHYATGDPNYAYTPTQGINTTRLFGPYAFRFVPTDGETGAQLYTDAVDSMSTLGADYNMDSELITNGYVMTSSRGAMRIAATNSAGWSSNTTNNTIVLSQPNTNFQESTQGYQYWTQLSSAGAGTISNVAPGTYRLTMYELGQWGETRVDGVVVNGNQIAIPQNLKFTPENFGTAAPIWTIGTPNRSANEFLNGSNTTVGNGVTLGGDLREYYGAYNYWQQEANLGNNGKVVYYATAVGSTPATNNTQAWIANQWQIFDPGIYNSTTQSTNGYTPPSYVGNAATYKGTPWQVHFTTTTAQDAQGQFVVLSVALAASESNLQVALNGNSETWTAPSDKMSDAMVRSGDAGIYQWIAFEFPTTDLLAPGGNDDFTFTVTSPDGVMYDALRMEIANSSANPATTGWYDYYYVNSNEQINPDDALGLSTSELFVALPEPSGGALALAATAIAMLAPRRRSIPRNRVN